MDTFWHHFGGTFLAGFLAKRFDGNFFGFGLAIANGGNCLAGTLWRELFGMNFLEGTFVPSTISSGH